MMGLTVEELQEKYETLIDPRTRRKFKLPRRAMKKYPCTDGLLLKDIETRDIHELPESGIPILLGGKYPAPEKGASPRAYTIPIPHPKKSVGGILKHPHPEGQWCVYPIGEIYLNGLLLDEIKPLDRDFSKIQAGKKEFRVFYKF